VWGSDATEELHQDVINMPSPMPAQNAPMIPKKPQLIGLVFLVVAGPSRVSIGSPKMR